MTYEFGDFRLDTDRRSLTLSDQEVALQPKAFDLLCYLVEARERVVDRSEILDALWPDVVVSDGSLKRAVSLVRQALRAGGAEDAVRTYQRRGYRFCHRVTYPSAIPDAPPPDAGQATTRHDDSAPPPAHLERQGRAAHHGGRLPEAIEPLQRAVSSFAAEGDLDGAARCALHLAHVHYEQRELTVGRGWLRRALSYLPEDGAHVERGHHAWLASRFAVAEGDIAGAIRLAERAYDIGRSLRDTNLEALGLLYKGLALIAHGEVRRGCEHHDEAAAAVLSAEIEPWVGGLVYCGMIFTCRSQSDWRRAAEWTERFTRLCEDSDAHVPGTCQLHRAEVLRVSGDVGQAKREASRICAELAVTAPWAEGDAHRLLGDLCLAQGDLDEAERAYGRAHQLGWEPQPGLALLLAARGRPDAGMRALERALEAGDWHSQQRRGQLLAQLVHVALGAGEPETARGALARLEGRPELWHTPALEASLCEARAALARHESDLRRAVVSWQRALHLYREAGSPLDVARSHIGLAESLLEQDDTEAAELELGAAAVALHGLGAASLERELARVRALARS